MIPGDSWVILVWSSLWRRGGVDCLEMWSCSGTRRFGELRRSPVTVAGFSWESVNGDFPKLFGFLQSIFACHLFDEELLVHSSKGFSSNIP